MHSPLPPPPVKPFAVADESYAIIMRAAAPLARGLRDAFLEEVASTLRTVGDPGPGELWRLCREVQRKYWDPPLDHGFARASKHARG
jgi:hypothetical protein